MSYRRRHLVPPPGREALDALRWGSGGVWWERGDGLVVRLAAPEQERGHERAVERSRVSLIGMLLAYVASGGPR